MRARTTLPGLLAGTILFAACSDTPTDPPSRPPQSDARASKVPGLQEDLRPGERPFRQLAAQVPAFGGFYLDEQRQLAVWLTDLAQSGAMRNALVPFLQRLGEERGRAGARLPAMVFHEAEYTFLQLSEWRDRIVDPVLSLEGVVLIDMDERYNRVTVGLVDGSGRAEAEAELQRLNVPLGAVRFKVTGQPEPVSARAAATSTTGCTNLERLCRPLIGGYQTTFFKGGAEKVCTITASAIWSGEVVLLTAAHCSEYEWDLDGEVYYQPYYTFSSPPPQVAVEAHDPRGWSCGTFSPYKCRYSDALLARVDPGVTAEVGYIARTTGIHNGSLTVSSTSPKFVVAGASDAYVGETVHMIGRTLGWQRGKVTETCVSLEQSNWHRTECTDVSDHNAEGGDSGGPTFLWDGSSDRVTLVGLTFARNAFYDHTFFSPMSGIQKDLGALEVRALEYRSSTGTGGGGGGGTCDSEAAECIME